MNICRRRFSSLGILSLLVPGCRSRKRASAASSEAAALIVSGGRIVTLDPEKPVVEAIAIRGGVVQAIGRGADIEALAGPDTRRLDLAGGVAVPGLTDAHGHLLGLGRSLETVDLRGAESIDAVVRRLKSVAGTTTEAESWLVGFGWDQNLWPPDEQGQRPMPTHQPLTAAFPERPVWLERIDGHAAWTNARGLELAGIDPDTPDPEGGEILRDGEGNPTGVLIDTAMGYVEIPEPTQSNLEGQLLAAQEHVLERGLTGVHEMGVSAAADAAIRALVQSGKWKLRVHGYADLSWFLRELAERQPEKADPEDRYVLQGVKVFADGALGSRGAALLEPYADRPDHSGMLMQRTEALARIASTALAAGWQVATHAIGDRGNRMVLDAYESALRDNPARDHRLRIEHAQIVHPDDIARFAELGVLASLQPTHATSDMPWVPDRLGRERLDRAYPWRRFLDAGVRLPLGSDFPVEKADPTHGLYAAVTRQDADGNPAGGWLPDQRLTLDEAIAGFTADAAYATHRDGHLGRLSVGYQADLTCFREDLWELEPLELREAKPTATVIAGEVVYGGNK